MPRRFVACCKYRLAEEPFSSAIFVFRNRCGTALKLLSNVGGGYWLITRRLSEGRLRWWPDHPDRALLSIEFQHRLLTRRLAKIRVSFHPARIELSVKSLAQLSPYRSAFLQVTVINLPSTPDGDYPFARRGAVPIGRDKPKNPPDGEVFAISARSSINFILKSPPDDDGLTKRSRRRSNRLTRSCWPPKSPLNRKRVSILPGQVRTASEDHAR